MGRAHEAVITSDPLSDNQWHHLAGVRDQGEKKLRFYVDGVLINEVNDETQNIDSGQSIWIGFILRQEHINWLNNPDWTKEYVWELDGANIRINTVDQQYPFHYNNKDFAKTLNEHYDKLLGRT